MFSKKPIPRAAAGEVLSLVVTNSLRTDFFDFFFFLSKAAVRMEGRSTGPFRAVLKTPPGAGRP